MNVDNDFRAWEEAGQPTADGTVSGLACDWWNRAEEDFDRAALLGLNTLRLSIEWSRIEPEPGRWNAAALDRYREMLKGLREGASRPSSPSTTSPTRGGCRSGGGGSSPR